MDKLIITVAPTDGVLYKPSEFPCVPVTLEEIVETVAESYKAGAAIAHLHGPWRIPEGGQPVIDVEGWHEMARLVRQRCPGMIIQFGVAGAPLEDRIRLIQGDPSEKPEMMAVCLTPHDYNFWGKDFYIMHTRPELEAYLRVCAEEKVKPAFEVFHYGAFWNLEWLRRASRSYLHKPLWLTMFMGSTGSVWSPPTVSELEERLRYMPEGSLWEVAPRAAARGTVDAAMYMGLVMHAIAAGGHVRIGVEDNPYYAEGVIAASNAQLVDRVAQIARLVGREVATPDEARRMLGLEG